MEMEDSEKLESVLGIGAVAASQSMSSASWQRVWPRAGAALMPPPLPHGDGRACVGPQSCDTQGTAETRGPLEGVSHILGGGPEVVRAGVQEGGLRPPVGRGLGGAAWSGTAQLEAALDQEVREGLAQEVTLVQRPE